MPGSVLLSAVLPITTCNNIMPGGGGMANSWSTAEHTSVMFHQVFYFNEHSTIFSETDFYKVS